MGANWQRWLWKLSIPIPLFAGGLITFSMDCTLAQITPDGTLGTENSVVMPATINTLPAEEIRGGAIRGTNLFHSFQQFNIGEGQQVYFANPTGIENILSRVTGNDPSDILGTLGVQGNANLFLLNPNGIIFGRNARLNVNGSFIASTANAIGLANGDIFSVNPLQPLPEQLLNVNPNTLFLNQIGAQPAQPIINRSRNQTGLEVPIGQSLLLVGGEVRLESGRMQAHGGRIELGGLAAEGSVGLSQSDGQWSLSFPEGVARADVFLTNLTDNRRNGARVNVASENGGSIAIHARNLEVSGGSTITAGIGRNLGAVGSQAGDITINAIEDISISGRDSRITNSVARNATGNGGAIAIRARSLSLTDRAGVSANTDGNGQAGSVIVQVDGLVTLVRSQISSQATGNGKGNSGDIDIRAESLSMSEGADLNATNSGKGNAGSVRVQVDGSVTLEGRGTTIFTQVEEEGEGNSGDITIDAGSLSLKNGAEVNANTEGQGNAGNVTLHVDGALTIQDANVFSEVGGNATGNGGSIDIRAGSLLLTRVTPRGSARLSTVTRGSSNTGNTSDAGNITLQVDGAVRLENSARIMTTVYASGRDNPTIGNGGDITIQAQSFSAINGGYIEASTRDLGDAGNIEINASDFVELSGTDESKGYTSALSSSTGFEATGRGGNIIVNTDELRLSNGAALNAQSRSESRGGDIIVNANTVELTSGAQLVTTAFENGDAGNLTVNATESIILSGSDRTYFDRVARANRRNQRFPGNRDYELLILTNGPASGLLAQTEGSGDGGNLTINTRQLIVRDGTQASVSSQESGNSGSLTVNANSIFLDNQGKLSASTASGEGGNIELQVQDFILMRRNSSIEARADNNGNGGNILINAPFIIAVSSENSDIVADAVQGQGGNINITTEGIYGLEYRPQRTALSDINASSEFGVNGTVQINTPDVDPSQGLAELPGELVNNVEVTQGCQGEGKQESIAFFNKTGGNLAPTPYEPISSSEFWEDVSLSIQTANTLASVASASASATTLPDKIVEAKGWIVNENGEVTLIAEVPAPLSQSRCSLR